MLSSVTHLGTIGGLLHVAYTLGPRKNGPPKHALKIFKISKPILMKICPTVIEILTFNKWSQKFTVSRSVISYLQSMELTDVSIDAIVVLAK